MGMAHPTLRHVTCRGFHGGQRQTHQSRHQCRFSVQTGRVRCADLPMIAIDMGMAHPALRHVTCWGFHGGKRQTHQSRLQSRFSVQPAQVHGASLSNIASSPDSHQTEPRPGWFSDFFGFFHLARQKKVKKSGPNRSKTIEIRKFTKKLRTHVPRLIIRRSHAAVRAGRDWPGSDRPAPHQVAGILPLRADYARPSWPCSKSRRNCLRHRPPP
jgi:hypothetical protein